MNTISFKTLENAAGEYKRAAKRLLEYAVTLNKIVEKTCVNEEQRHRMTSCIERIRSQGRQLDQLSDSLEEIVSTSSARMRDPEVEFPVAAYDTYGGEFGESRFENLERHEEIIPIHSV